MGFLDKAKALASEHPDLVGKALDPAEKLADKETDGKYHNQISKGGDALEKQVDKQLGVKGSHSNEHEGGGRHR